MVQERWQFSPKEHNANIKYGSGSKMFSGCFSSRSTEQLIAIRGIMKSEDYIKIQDENLQLSMQNLDFGQQFTFQQDNDPKDVLISDCVASEKQDYTSAMAFNKSWFESYWKSLARIESLNKFFITKKASGIRMYYH